jgi:hypothetical protein
LHEKGLKCVNNYTLFLKNVLNITHFSKKNVQILAHLK